MKINRMTAFFLALLSTSLAGVFTLMYFQQRELSTTGKAQELLKEIPFEERKSLSDICRSLFNTTAFGYTLFGDKPVSVIYNGRIDEGMEISFFQRHLLIMALKGKKKLDAPHFAIVVQGEGAYSFIYLVNKKEFLHTVQQNIQIFRDILGENITPHSLLQSVLDVKSGFEKALSKNHALFGILFGYGVENSLRFDRRHQLETPEVGPGFPPWKGIQDLSQIDWFAVETFDGLRTRAKKGLALTTPPKAIVPSAGFPSVEAELIDLNKKLAPVAGAKEPCSLLPIVLPQFAGDPESEETRMIVEKYQAQRRYLLEIVSEENMIEKVLEKFYTNDGAYK